MAESDCCVGLLKMFFGLVFVAAAAACLLVGGIFQVFSSAGGSQSMERPIFYPPPTSAPFTIIPELAEWVGTECGISIGVNEIFGALSALGVSSKADLRYITDAMLAELTSIPAVARAKLRACFANYERDLRR